MSFLLFQEDFNKLRVLSYIKSDVFIVCFSVNNPESLHHVSEVWVPELKQYVPDTPFIVVGTNIDVRCQQPDVQVCNNSVTTIEREVIGSKPCMHLTKILDAVSSVSFS